MTLTAAERSIVSALGQTMFPRDGAIGLDGQDAEVVAYLDDYLGRMPPLSRTQIRALLATFELGFAVWSGRPRAVFSGARPDDRAAYLESWERSATYTQRMLYEALRVMMTFAYVDAPAVDAVIHPPGSRVGASAWAARRAAGDPSPAGGVAPSAPLRRSTGNAGEAASAATVLRES